MHTIDEQQVPSYRRLCSQLTGCKDRLKCKLSLLGRGEAQQRAGKKQGRVHLQIWRRKFSLLAERSTAAGA